MVKQSRYFETVPTFHFEILVRGTLLVLIQNHCNILYIGKTVSTEK